MKLQKQVAYKIKGKDYHKYVINIPPNKIEELGWKEGIELIDELKGNFLCIRPATEKELIKNPEQSIYEDFKNSVKNILERYPAGLIWAQIRDKLNYHQIAPNNKWVRKMEEDIGLKRIKKGGETIWFLENDTIYTIGYEGYSIENFIKKLQDSNIQQLIDVREIALSRKNGFSKGILQSELKKAGIIYKHIPELGSPKEIRHQLHEDWNYKRFFDEYKNHINDLEILECISDIEGRARRKKSVLLCFEKDYKTCHRSIIAEELKRRGWIVNHL